MYLLSIITKVNINISYYVENKIEIFKNISMKVDFFIFTKITDSTET